MVGLAAAVYNLGGGRATTAQCSRRSSGASRSWDELNWELSDPARMGDHRWWISDLRAFQDDYPDWKLEDDVEAMLRESYEQNVEQWTALV